jgi:hypothetical protein
MRRDRRRVPEPVRALRRSGMDSNAQASVGFVYPFGKGGAPCVSDSLTRPHTTLTATCYCLEQACDAVLKTKLYDSALKCVDPRSIPIDAASHRPTHAWTGREMCATGLRSCG